MTKLYRLFILSALFSTAAAWAFADDPSSALDEKPSVDTAADSNVQVPAVPSSDTAAQTHTSYLYDLKQLIERSKENIKEVNDKITQQAILKRNQEREERAHEYYEKGEELTKEGKLDEAREYFEKAIRITENPEMQGYVKESQRRLKKQEAALQSQERQHYNQIKQDENARKQDVETAYRQAIDLYRQKQYHPAKDAFNHVDEIAPDYRATRSYLRIIDQDIILADAMSVKQKAVEAAKQQQEAEVAQAKEKETWLKQIEEKEKERKEQTEQQANDAYNEAVQLYKNKKYAEAKKKFQEVSWVIPDYKDTMKYLRRIDKDAKVEEERVAEEKQKTLEEQRWEDLVESKKQEALREHEAAINAIKHRKELEEQAQFIYSAAVALYDKKDLDGAWQKFTDIEKTCPDYKSTRAYIARIEQVDPAKYKVVQPAPAPVAINPEQAALSASLEDQQKQMRDISDLARRAADLYSKVSDIADDRSTVQMKRKMAELDKILNNLKVSKEHLVRQMLQAQLKHQQEETKAEQDKHRAEAEEIYQDAIRFLRDRDYERARLGFLQVEGMIPNYKATQRYLSRIDKEQGGPNIAPATGYEHNQTEVIQQFKKKENTEEALRNQQEQQKKHEMELQQQEQIQKLAEQASMINDEIISLSRDQNYDAMRAKFTELENTITALRAIKDSMNKQKDLQKQLANESARHKMTFQSQPNVEQYKRGEVKQEENMLYSQAVGLYKEKKYTEAKLLFTELDSRNDRRAGPWLKKVDHAISRYILSRQAQAERDRSAFIADQVKAQRRLARMQEEERQRQKKLNEELERQKRLYEDQQALQLRKEATLKAQEQERERQEEKRLRQEKENEKEQEMYRFHRITSNAQSGPSAATGPASQQPLLEPSLPVVSTPEALEARRRAVRKQLEEGVEAMYKEALNLYRQGSYTAAADKFKDIQDIFPGYKHSEQYLDEARQRSLTQKQPAVVATEASSNMPATPVAVTAPASVSREDAVSKALDLFDSNVQ